MRFVFWLAAAVVLIAVLLNTGTIQIWVHTTEPPSAHTAYDDCTGEVVAAAENPATARVPVYAEHSADIAVTHWGALYAVHSIVDVQATTGETSRHHFTCEVTYLDGGDRRVQWTLND
jgi:hypothetical protein